VNSRRNCRKLFRWTAGGAVAKLFRWTPGGAVAKLFRWTPGGAVAKLFRWAAGGAVDKLFRWTPGGAVGPEVSFSEKKQGQITSLSRFRKYYWNSTLLSSMNYRSNIYCDFYESNWLNSQTKVYFENIVYTVMTLSDVYVYAFGK